MKKVAVIGHFAYGMEYLDGQTIKTKIVTEELQKQLGDEQVGKTDTHGGIKTLFKAPFHAFNALKNSKNVIIFPAHNSLRVYAPLLSEITLCCNWWMASAISAEQRMACKVLEIL